MLKNLARRKARTILTASGVAIGVALIVALLSISAGVQNTAKDLIHVGRSDFGLFQAGASDLTRSVLPQDLAAKVAAQSGVSQVASTAFRVGGVEGRDSFLLFGLKPNEFPYKRLVVLSGKRSIANSEVLLGDNAAASLHKKPGDLLHLQGHSPVKIVGIYHSGNAFVDRGAVTSLPFVQSLLQQPNEITTIAVNVNPGSKPSQVANEIQKHFPGLAAITEPGQAVKVDTSSKLIVSAGWIFSLIALIVGGISVMNTMAMSVFERMHEIGILRAVGWNRKRIAALIVSETIGICLLAVCIGFVLGVLAAELFISQGSLSTLVTPRFSGSVFAWGLAFALAVGLIGALYPAWRATQLRPIEALQRT